MLFLAALSLFIILCTCKYFNDLIIKDPKIYVIDKYTNYIKFKYYSKLSYFISNEELMNDIIKKLDELILISASYEFNLYDNLNKFYTNNEINEYLTNNIILFNESNINEYSLNEFKINKHSLNEFKKYYYLNYVSFKNNKFNEIIINYFLDDIYLITSKFVKIFNENFNKNLNTCIKYNSIYYINDIYYLTTKNQELNNIFYHKNNNILNLTNNEITNINNNYECFEIIKKKCPINTIYLYDYIIKDCEDYIKCKYIKINKCCTF